MSKKIKIMLAEHDEQFRNCLVSLLRINPGFDVTGAVQTGKALLQQLKEIKTDVVVFAPNAIVAKEVQVPKGIRTLYPKIKVIVLSDQKSEPHLQPYLPIAHGFIGRSSTVESLYAAIKAVHRGEKYIDDTMAKALSASSLSDEGTGKENKTDEGVN